MRILVLSDIHANYPALKAVIEDAGPVDAVWCLGDIVGYGPHPQACIETIQALPTLTCLLGNHDAAACGKIDLDKFNREAHESMLWQRSQLSPDSLAFLSSLPEKSVDYGILLAHGSPRNTLWEYILDSYTATANINEMETSLGLVGHSHIPIIASVNEESSLINMRHAIGNEIIPLPERAILNPGSVGQPRDHNPRASYAILSLSDLTWQIKRVDYDILAVQEAIQKAGLPAIHALRLASGW